MNLSELKERIDVIYKISENPDKVSVRITLDESSIGGRASVGVSSIMMGFDWESNQLRIEPDKSIVKKPRVSKEK